MIKINVVNKDDVTFFSALKIGEYFTIQDTPSTYLYLKASNDGTCISFYDGHISPNITIMRDSMKIIRLSNVKVNINIDVIK